MLRRIVWVRIDVCLLKNKEEERLKQEEAALLESLQKIRVPFKKIKSKTKSEMLHV